MLFLMLISSAVSAQTITSISPQCGIAGQGFRMNVSGTGFNTSGSNSAIVLVGGKATLPVSASSTLIVVDVPAAAVPAIGNYNVVVSQKAGAEVSSSKVLTVIGPPTASAVQRCGPGTVTLDASGAPTGASYRWYTVETGGTAIAGATNPSYTTPSLTATTVYYVSMTAPEGCESSRTAVTATVNPIPLAPTVPAPAAVCGSGQVNMTATPGTNGNSARWYTAETGGTLLSTGLSYSPNVTATTTYYVSGYNTTTGCESSTRTAVTATVNPVPTAPTNVTATPATLCGSGTPTLKATAGTDGTTLKWYDASTGGNLLETGTSYTPAAAISTTTTYYASSYNATTTCESSSRVAVTVTVNPVPVATITQGATASFCAGGSTTLTAQTAAGNSYIWFKGGSPLANQPEGNSLVVSEAGDYTVEVTNKGCSKMSAVTAVSETSLPKAVINPPAKTSLCAGESVTLSAETGTGYSYVWTKNNNTISGETGATLAVSQAGDYRVIVKANNCSATSGAVTITVNPVPVATITAEGPLEFCLGGYVTLNGPEAPAGQTFTYEWFLNDISVQQGSEISYRAVASGSYTLTVTSAAGCSNTSPERVVTVGSPTEAAISYEGETEFCQGGGSLELRATRAPEGQTYTYQWLRDGNKIPAAEGGTGRIYTATTTGSYQVVVSDAGCTKTSDAVAVTAYPQPSANIEGNDQFQCVESENSFTVTGSFTGSGATWSSSNDDFTIEVLTYSMDSETGQWQTTAKVTTIGAGNAIISLTASRATTGCTEAVATKGLTVRPLPETTVTAGGPTTFCAGEFVILSAPEGSGYTYKWFKEGDANPVGLDKDYKVSVGGAYFVEVTSNTCPATSEVTTVTVNPLPTAVVSPTGPVAICDGSSVTLNASSDTGTGFTWFRGTEQVGTGASYEAKEAGSYTVRVTNGTCSNVSAATVVTVNPAPSASIEVIGTATFCQGGTVTLRAPAAPAGQTYTYQWLLGGDPIATQANGMDYVASASGNYTVRVTNTSTTLNCNTTTATPVAVTVNPTPSFTVVNPAAVCAPGTVNLTASGIKTDASEPLTYTYWTDEAATTALNSPSAVATTGTYYIKGTSGAGCSVVKPVTVTIYPRPTVSITSPTAASYCVSDAAQPLTGNPTGGSFRILQGTTVRATNATAFDPAALGAGNYTIEYSYTNSNGCTNTATKNVTVNPLPTTPTISGITANSVIYTGERVNGSYSRTLTGSAPGTFSGPGVTTAGVFTPCSVLSAGQDSRDIVITYTVTNTSTGCTSAVNVPVTVKRSTYTLVLQAVPFPVCQGVNTTYTARVLRDAVVIYPAPANIRTVPVKVESFEEDVTGLFIVEARKVKDGDPGNFNRGTTFSDANLSATDYIEARATPNAAISCATITEIFSNKIYLGTPEVNISISNPGSICPGTSVTFTATQGSLPGEMEYQWTVNGQPVSGATGATFTSSTLQNGDKVAVLFNAVGSNCKLSNSKNTITMVVVTSPTITGGGPYCSGGSGVSIVLQNSQSGVSYRLIQNGTTVVRTVAGTGSNITFSGITAAGSYTVAAVAATNSSVCSTSNAVNVSVTSPPVAYNVTGGGSYCQNGSGLVIGLSSSQTGVSYQLRRTAGGTTTNVESALNGTGSALSFGSQTLAGVYSVVATNITNATTAACSQIMDTPQTITVNTLPTAQTITTPNSTNYCAGSAGVLVGLGGSQSGVVYTLRNSANTAVATVNGTGAPVSFGNVKAGNYTVLANNTTTTCSSSFGSVIISETPLPTVTVNSPATCAGTPVTVTAEPSGGSGTYTTYSWTVPQGATDPGNVASFTTTVAGTYTVSVRDDKSCESSQPAKSTVTVNPMIDVVGDIAITNSKGPISDTNPIMFEEPVTFTAQSNITDRGDARLYVWYTGSEADGDWEEVYRSSTSNVFTLESAPADPFDVKVEVTPSTSACYAQTFYTFLSRKVTPLPVEIIYLNAAKQGNDVVLEWATAMEQDNTGFEVQVSTDGFNYRLLNFVPAKNGSSSTKQEYVFTDKENGKFGTRYYRLKQIDTNGTFEFFGPKAVTFGSVASKVIAFPNPFHDEVTLDIASETDGEALVTVTDAVGKQLLVRKVQVQKGFTTEKLRLDADMPRGLYIIKTQVGGVTQYIKMIKE